MRYWIPLTLVAATAFTSAAPADIIAIPPRKDATMYSDSNDRANALGPGLFIGDNANGYIRRTTIAFDVAGAVPAGSTITGVTLTLRCTRAHGVSGPTELHRLDGDWGEFFANAPDPGGNGTMAGPGDVTWTDRFFDQNMFWNTPGGDFESVVSSSATVGGSNVTYTWPSTPQFVADVQSMLDNPGANFGWVLLGNETVPGAAKRFASREYPDASMRPKMTITYTVPGPGVASAMFLGLATAGRRRRKA